MQKSNALQFLLYIETSKLNIIVIMYLVKIKMFFSYYFWKKAILSLTVPLRGLPSPSSSLVVVGGVLVELGKGVRLVTEDKV